MAAGFDEASFWRQTPASHAAIWQALAAERQARREERVGLDHLAAQMNALASVGKLNELDNWLAAVRPARKRSVAEMILTLQDAAARGAPLRITRH